MSSSGGGNDGARLVVSVDDHRAVVVIVVVSCLLWSIMVISARAIWRYHQKSDFGWDDAIATLGTAFGAAQAGVTLAAVKFRFGKQQSLVNKEDVDEAGKYLYSAVILYILAMCASRASMPLLITRLTREQKQARYALILLVVTVIWGFASTLGIAFHCGVPVALLQEAESRCGGLLGAWTAIEVIGVLIEVGIVIIAVTLVANLQMAMRFKVAVVGSFAFRLLLIIPVAFRLGVLHNVTLEEDLFFGSVDLMIVTQIILHYSLWAASFPCMRAFLRAFDTGMGVTTRVSTRKGSNYATDGMKRSSSYVLGSISKEKMFSRRTTTVEITSPITPVEPDVIGKAMIAGHPPRHGHVEEAADSKQARNSDETGSESSSKAIITRTVEWKVNYEDAAGRAT